MGKTVKLDPRDQPSTSSRKTDEELRMHYGISNSCSVCISQAGLFLLKKAKVIPDKQFKSMMKKANFKKRRKFIRKEFHVYYGKHFLQQIANFAYNSTTDYDSVDFDQLYSTYITSRFTTLTRVKFKTIIQSFFITWQNQFNKRRADLIAKKIAEINAKRKAAREALRRLRISYKNNVVIVRNCIAAEAKQALLGGLNCRVMLERILVNDLQISKEPPTTESCETSVVDEDMDSALTDTEDDSEDPRTETLKLVMDLIDKTSQELESSGFDEFTEDYFHEQDATNESFGQTTECDSDDTVESSMEVGFGSEGSPDFFNVLQISRQEEMVDSEETCNGDGFATHSCSSYTCDTDQSNSGLLQENGQDSDSKHEDMDNGMDRAGESNCVIKQAIRSQNQSIVVVPMRLCN